MWMMLRVFFFFTLLNYGIIYSPARTHSKMEYKLRQQAYHKTVMNKPEYILTYIRKQNFLCKART